MVYAEHTTHVIDKKYLATRMKERRRVQGVSWAHVAREELGISRNSVYKIIKQEGAPYGDTLVSIMMWLGVTDITPFVMTREEAKRRDRK